MISTQYRAAFKLLNTKLNAEEPTNKQQPKEAAVKAWQSILKEGTQHLVMSTGFRESLTTKALDPNIKNNPHI